MVELCNTMIINNESW